MRQGGGAPPDRLLSVEEARRLVLAPLEPLPSERVALGEAFGRILAAPARALDAAPPFDSSEMDGYAVRAADVASAAEGCPAVLPVAFEVHAGEVALEPSGSGPGGRARPLPPGTACWIATGATVPPGADSIVPREWTRPLGDGRVAIERPPAGPGAFIRRRGEDYEAGETLLEPGTLLGPGAVALAASCGAAALDVHRRPRVALLATGDELLEPGAPLEPGKIRESNRLLLAGLVAAAGGEPHDLGIVRDEIAATRGALERAFEFDVAVTSGGASVGERDLVREALAAVGAPPRFWGIEVKPGKPLAFATRRRPDGRLSVLFALPGNPSSSLVSFHLFVAPALRFLTGRRDVDPLALEATLEAAVRAAPDRRTYLRGRLRATPAGLAVRPLGRQASGSVRSVGGANALLVLPAGAALEAGARVTVEPLGLVGLDPAAGP